MSDYFRDVERSATFSADRAVAELYAPGGDGAALLAQRFGERFIAESGGVDKRALFAAMVESPGLRREVERVQRDRSGERRREFHPDWLQSAWSAAR